MYISTAPIPSVQQQRHVILITLFNKKTVFIQELIRVASTVFAYNICEATVSETQQKGGNISFETFNVKHLSRKC